MVCARYQSRHWHRCVLLSEQLLSGHLQGTCVFIGCTEHNLNLIITKEVLRIQLQGNWHGQLNENHLGQA